MKKFRELMEELKTTTDQESVRAEIAEMAIEMTDEERAKLLEAIWDN